MPAVQNVASPFTLVRLAEKGEQKKKKREKGKKKFEWTLKE